MGTVSILIQCKRLCCLSLHSFLPSFLPSFLASFTQVLSTPPTHGTPRTPRRAAVPARPTESARTTSSNSHPRHLIAALAAGYSSPSPVWLPCPRIGYLATFPEGAASTRACRGQSIRRMRWRYFNTSIRVFVHFGRQPFV